MLKGGSAKARSTDPAGRLAMPSMQSPWIRTLRSMERFGFRVGAGVGHRYLTILPDVRIVAGRRQVFHAKAQRAPRKARRKAKGKKGPTFCSRFSSWLSLALFAPW